MRRLSVTIVWLFVFRSGKDITRLSFEVFSLESPWTLDYVLAPIPPLGIRLAVREGRGPFFSLREAYVLSFSLLLCLEPCEKFSVGGGGWVGDGGLQ